MLSRQQQRLVDRFDFENPWHLQRFQNLTNQKNEVKCMPMQTSYAYLSEFGNFESLTAALNYTGLDKVLDSEGKFTVFAPTDNAFAKLPAGLVNTLLTDPSKKAALTDILLYHVVSGATVPAATAMTLTSATMADGKTITIKMMNGNLFINNSQVVLYDVMTSNGIIHVIDTVLIP